MTKLIGPVALAVMSVALAPKTALAEGPPITGNFTVSYAVGGGPGFPDCGPNSVYIEAHGIGSTGTAGTMFLTVNKCLNFLNGTYAGTFTLSSPDAKDTVTGTYTGANDSYTGYFPAVFRPFHGVLSATSGTGKFRNAKGSLNFIAISNTTTAYYALEGNVLGD